MKPTIWIYGGVHYDPGSRQRFLEELTKQKTPPHFVAVEWGQSVFECFAAWRLLIEEGLRAHWSFLTREDCHELSLAFAWEGDAYAERFPDTEILWLDEARLQSPGSDVNKFAKENAKAMLQKLCCFPTFQELKANTAPLSEPRSKQEIVDRIWRTQWVEAHKAPKNFERDPQWTEMICERSAALRDGWIAVVVGWVHAELAAGNQQLRGLLLSQGFSVEPICLGP